MIPEKDRKLLDPDAWLSASVALDVLSTALGKSAAADITTLTQCALELADLGGHTDDDTQALLATAHGETGQARAAIAPQLAGTDAVTNAIALLRDGAQALVEEARLEIEASAMTSYRKG